MIPPFILETFQENLSWACLCAFIFTVPDGSTVWHMVLIWLSYSLPSLRRSPPQAAFRSVDNAVEQLERRPFDFSMHVASFRELQMGPQECRVSLNVLSPQSPHLNGFIAVPSRPAFQLFCHCNFTYNCMLTKSFFDSHLNYFVIFISSNNSFVI